MKKRLGYIWDYYKFPIIVFLMIIYVLGYISYRQLTKKENLLSIASINIDLSEADISHFSKDYLEHKGSSQKRYQITFYNHLISQGDPNDGASYEYAYASSMKLLAMMTAKSLDIVLMDEKAYHTFSSNGYLYSLENYNLSAKKTESNDAICILLPAFSEKIYVGIIQNSRHLKEDVQYLEYIS